MANGSVSGERQQAQPGFSGYPSSLMLINEGAEIVILPVGLNLSLPPIASPIPGDATIHRGRSFSFGDVLFVLGASGRTKIGATVVESISVPVISTRFAPSQSEKFSVQQESFTREVASIGFPVDVPVLVEMPTPLTHEGSIDNVNDCVGDDPITCKDGDAYGILAVHLDSPLMPALDS